MNYYFLITSYTGDPYGELKSSHLIKFLKQIKKYVPNSFIVLIDSNYTNNIEKYCDIFIHEKYNFNSPHGTGDLNKTKLGLSILKNLNVKYFTKLTYDFWFNDITYKKFLEWHSFTNNKKIISAAWKLDDHDHGTPNSMAFNFGIYEINAAEQLFNFETVQYPIEMQLYQRAFSLFSPEDIYLYPNFMLAFNEENFDIFNNSGDNYSIKRLEKTLRE